MTACTVKVACGRTFDAVDGLAPRPTMPTIAATAAAIRIRPTRCTATYIAPFPFPDDRPNRKSVGVVGGSGNVAVRGWGRGVTSARTKSGS
jgi:hypothetical protein